MVEQLPGGLVLALLNYLNDLAVIAIRDMPPQELDEFVDIIAGEKRIGCEQALELLLKEHV